MPKLTLFVPDAEPMKIAFEDQEVVNVGRAADNDIVLEHDSISGHHAQLKLVDGSYVLIDLDSTNGTYYEGAPANENVLRNGAELAFGQVAASYEVAEEAEQEAEQEAVDSAESDAAGFSDGESGESLSHSIHAQPSSQAARPEGFDNLSPLGKLVQKDVVGQSILVVGILGLLAAAATIASALMMNAG